VLQAYVVLSPDNSEIHETIIDLTSGLGADLTIETVGGKSDATLKQSTEVTRMQGRIVILGGFRIPLIFDWLEPLLKEQSVIFSSCYSILEGDHDYESAIDLMDSGKVSMEQMVTHVFSLSDIQKGFDTAYDKSSSSIKVRIHQ